MRKIKVSGNKTYIDVLSKKYNVPKSSIKMIINILFKNIRKGIIVGKDINLKGDLGYLYFQKVEKAKHLKKTMKKIGIK